MSLRDRLNLWARAARRDAVVLWVAARDPRTPWLVRALCAAAAAYALSPIDLIPDVLPVLGYLDEALLLPLVVLAVVRLTPPALVAEFRAEAERRVAQPRSRAGAAAIIGIWMLSATVFGWLLWRTA